MLIGVLTIVSGPRSSPRVQCSLLAFFWHRTRASRILLGKSTHTQTYIQLLRRRTKSSLDCCKSCPRVITDVWGLIDVFDLLLSAGHKVITGLIK